MPGFKIWNIFDVINGKTQYKSFLNSTKHINELSKASGSFTTCPNGWRKLLSDSISIVSQSDEQGEFGLIKVGVVGFGYWGPRLVRNFSVAPGADMRIIADFDPTRRALACETHPGVKVTEHFKDLLHGDDVDLIVIATPLSSHYELALAALQAGRHVLIEKPIAATADETLRLIEAADRANRMLMVDHTFVYTEAVRKIHELIGSGNLGDIYYFDSVRVNLGLFQHDTNVIYDLAVHDLSIMDYVLPTMPTSVSATGTRHFTDQSENIAYLTLFSNDDTAISHIHVNWLAPVKVRRTLIGGSRKMIVYDDLDQEQKIKVYDKGIEIAETPDDIRKLNVSYRVGDLWAPNLEMREALQTMVCHALDSINNSTAPITDGPTGLRIVRYLEAADQSMKQNGVPVDIYQD